jgi:hypothetical protein
MKPWRPSLQEIVALKEAIRAARQVQTFLWGEANGKWGLEEWLKMFRKRVAKVEAIRRENPHADVELKKRLLQTAALSIALIGIIDRDGIPWDASPSAPPSNLLGADPPLTSEGRVPSVSKKNSNTSAWRGVGILSRRNVILEAYDDGDYAVRKFEQIPREVKGARLVIVTATLERATKKQCRNVKSPTRKKQC